MWFQVELPQPAMIAEVQFDAGAPGGRGVGGGRGGQRGQGPPAGRGAARRHRAAGDAAATPPQGGQPPPRRSRLRGAVPRRPSSAASRSATAFRCRWTERSWSAPVAEGKGSPATTVATFRPVQARFIRVTQTDSGENAPPWSVLNFRVYAVGK